MPKYYLIPYFNDKDNQKVYAYLFIKTLINPNQNLMSEKCNNDTYSYKLGNNKLWFSGGYPYPFGGNKDDQSISQCLKKELEQESHGKITTDLFANTGLFNRNDKKWSQEWINKVFKDKTDQTYYATPLRAKYKEPNNKNKKLSLLEKESTGIIVEIELTKKHIKEEILNKVKSKYTLGKKRYNENELKSFLSKSDFKDKEKAKECFISQYDSWNPEKEFLDSNTVSVLGSLFEGVFPPEC
jgi:hypothetical protein